MPIKYLLKSATITLLFFFSLTFKAHAQAPSNETLAVWANEAIIATYTFDYQNYRTQQKSIAHYFSASGWMAYTSALSKSALIETVTKNAFYVSSVAVAPPVITAINDHSWKAVMPILVLYKNAQFQQQQTLTITLKFSTVSANQGGVRGLAIDRLDSFVTKPPCQCMPTDTSAVKEPS